MRQVILLISVLSLTSGTPAIGQDKLTDPDFWREVRSKVWIDCAYRETGRLVDSRQPIDASVEHALGHCEQRAKEYEQALADYFASLKADDPEQMATDHMAESMVGMRKRLADYLRDERADLAFHRR